MLYMTVAVIYESTDKKICDLSENFIISNKFIFSGLLGTLPIAIFSFSCHPNVLEVYKVRKNDKN